MKYTEFERTYERILNGSSHTRKKKQVWAICARTQTFQERQEELSCCTFRKRVSRVRPLGKTWKIRANSEHEYFITKKIPSNLHYIYESGIIDWVKRIFLKGHHPRKLQKRRRHSRQRHWHSRNGEDQTLKIHILLLPELRYRKP